jgi:hypothetical protein
VPRPTPRLNSHLRLVSAQSVRTPLDRRGAQLSIRERLWVAAERRRAQLLSARAYWMGIWLIGERWLSLVCTLAQHVPYIHPRIHTHVRMYGLVAALPAEQVTLL